ncbi:MAG: chemotaxis protein CheA, partial [Myxococcales bacterium]|nr:chemotaxis protein CheA [Myxococcales bacterium]
MSLGSEELYDLFLALAPARLESARQALSAESGDRESRLQAALVPFAVDAALLGVDGLRELALATAASGLDAPEGDLERALEVLESAAEALAHGDESGARVNESELKARAKTLRSHLPQTSDAVPDAIAEEEGDDSVWRPTLDPDMIGAFLDECNERLEGLSERLLELESRGNDRELVSELFRDLHTLKGSSAFAGLKKMNRVAHLAEDLIGELRDGKREITRGLIDVLLETLDVLRMIVDKARARAPIDVEVGTLLQRLKDPEVVPFSAPKAAASAASGAAANLPPKPQAPRASSQASATLRIDFEKVDRLLNLVGEVVLARGRLTAAADSQGTLARELSSLRQKLSRIKNLPETLERGSGRGNVADELQRTERVLRETQGDLDSSLSVLGLAVSQLRDDVMKLRMVPISRLFSKYQRTVRELSHKLGKEVSVELVGAETELDKVLVERLEDPLLHLVRNAVDHGVEAPDERLRANKPRAGRLVLGATQRGGQILVTIQDDGRGMDPQKLRQKAQEKGILSASEARELSDSDSFQLIFRAGFSTAAQVSDVSGRGVGMDVVRDAISKLKGSIHLDSEAGRGTLLELRLPLTLAITQILAARVGGELVAIPLEAVASAQTVTGSELEAVGSGTCLRVADELIPVVDLARLLGLGSTMTSHLGDGAEHSVVIIELGTERFGLLVQQVLGRHEVVIKSLGPLLAGTPCAAGATLVGDRILLVVDLAEVATRSRDGA